MEIPPVQPPKPKPFWKQLLLVMFAAVGSVVVHLVVLGVSFALAMNFSPAFQGWFIQKMMTMQPSGFPEEQMGSPAPVPSYRGFEPDARAVKTAGDIFRVTNLWTVHLKFTAEQWRKLGPDRVKPVGGFMQADGRPALRNPAAPRPGVAGSLGIALPWSSGDVEFGGVTFTNAAIRYKGNGTYLGAMRLYKRPFKVDLNQHVKGQKLGGRSTLNFGNLSADASFVSDALAYELFRDAGVPAPRTAYARLFLTIAGEQDRRLLGLYVMAENPDAAWAREQFGAEDVALFKPVTYELFQDLGTNWAAYQAIYDPKTKVTAAHQQRIMDLARLVTHADEAAFAAGVGDLLDLDEAARFLACEVILSNYDGILAQGQNFLFYLDPRTLKVGIIPWDLDHSWGEFPFIGTAEQREQVSIAHPWEGENRFLERLFAVPAFQERYRKELERVLATLFVPDRLRRKVDALAALVRPAVAEQSAERLKRFETAVSDTFTSGPRDGGNPMGADHPVWQMKRFIDTRAANVRDQLDGKTEGLRISRKQ